MKTYELDVNGFIANSLDHPTNICVFAWRAVTRGALVLIALACALALLIIFVDSNIATARWLFGDEAFGGGAFVVSWTLDILILAIVISYYQDAIKPRLCKLMTMFTNICPRIEYK